MEGLNKFCKIKTSIWEIFGKIFGQTRETVEYKYINTRQTELWNNISLLFWPELHFICLQEEEYIIMSGCLALNFGQNFAFIKNYHHFISQQIQ